MHQTRPPRSSNKQGSPPSSPTLGDGGPPTPALSCPGNISALRWSPSTSHMQGSFDFLSLGKQKASWVHFFFILAKQAAWVLQKPPAERRRIWKGELSPQVGPSPSPAFWHPLFHHHAALKLGQAALSFHPSSLRGAEAAKMVPGLVSWGGRLQSLRCHGDRLCGAGDPGEGAARRHCRRIQSSGCRGAGDAERCHLGGTASASSCPLTASGFSWAGDALPPSPVSPSFYQGCL